VGEGKVYQSSTSITSSCGKILHYPCPDSEAGIEALCTILNVGCLVRNKPLTSWWKWLTIIDENSFFSLKRNDHQVLTIVLCGDCVTGAWVIVLPLYATATGTFSRNRLNRQRRWFECNLAVTPTVSLRVAYQSTFPLPTPLLVWA